MLNLFCALCSTWISLIQHFQKYYIILSWTILGLVLIKRLNKIAKLKKYLRFTMTYFTILSDKNIRAFFDLSTIKSYGHRISSSFKGSDKWTERKNKREQKEPRRWKTSCCPHVESECTPVKYYLEKRRMVIFLSRACRS